ncbi:hypothetical protein NEOC84_001902|nr:hypothetical protein [Neochlamydia sp. AcF84]
MSSFLLEDSRGSNNFKEPAAALRGLAHIGSSAFTRSSFKRLKASCGINTSPRTSNTSGMFFPYKRKGKRAIVLILLVITSPLRPSPRVKPRTKIPFS